MRLAMFIPVFVLNDFIRKDNAHTQVTTFAMSLLALYTDLAKVNKLQRSQTERRNSQQIR